MAAERHPLRDQPHHHGEQQRIHRRNRNAEDRQPVDVHEALRQYADHLTSFRVPQRQCVQDRPRAERRDERIDLRDLHEHAVDESRQAAAGALRSNLRRMNREAGTILARDEHSAFAIASPHFHPPAASVLYRKGIV